VIANRSDSSPERFRSALERLDWLGRSSPYLHIRQARRAFQARDLNGTLFELEQARALYPTKELWMAYGAVYEHKADWVAAGDAYEKAISLSEEHVQAWLALARVQERLGEPERALATLERAASLAPEDAIVREVLESRRRRAQDP
jgi:tetratricopeptide (TPR) repeat protein